MSRRIALWALTSVFVGAITFFILHEDAGPKDVDSEGIPTESRADQLTLERRTPQVQQEAHDEGATRLPKSAEDSVVASGSSDAGSPVPAGARSESQNAPSGDESPVEHLQDDTVVGQPFPVSPSVKLQCSPTPQVPNRCASLYDFLEEMAKEPRELQWAQSTEDRLADAIAKSDPAIFKIRALECRATHCAVEVWAPEEPWDGMLENDPALGRELSQITGKLGFETGRDGEKIVITIMVFLRR